MKNLQSTAEGSWIELKEVVLTEQQNLILISDNNEEKANLLLEIKANREVEPTQEDIDIALAKYNEVKPTLKEDDVYELISMDITIENESSLGILNCRINGEHKQIRF
jgi:ribosomal 30S subunit maturation factor RimM